MTQEQHDAVIKFCIAVTFCCTVIIMVGVSLYSVVFVTQPMNGMAPADKQFFCPCHQSAFDLDGKPKNETPPRMLDDLVAEVKDGVVFVEYKNYRTGTPEKVATQ